MPDGPAPARVERAAPVWLAPAERAAAGRAVRRRVPRRAHAEWEPAPGRADPIGLLEAQGASRVPELLPIRYGRMAASPFAFYRGAAGVMAADLAATPTSGLVVQACGDAHAANFGIFASPDRALVFDLNDFDETLPAPWEWDVKRLVASLAIAGRQRGFSAGERRAVVTATARTYRSTIRRFAGLGNLAVWYARMDATTVRQWQDQLRRAQIRYSRQQAAKALARDSSRAVARLTDSSGGEVRFLSQPPLLVPVDELLPGREAAELRGALQALLDIYAQSLRPALRHLLGTYRVVDIARKVVGVGSVGTRAWVILLSGRDPSDPLVLQAKEAQPSVLERHAGASVHDNHGERVVVGQRSMQAASDLFLGWLSTEGVDGVARDFYVRQLWDWKGSVPIDSMAPPGMAVYGELCGWSLARAHARTGDRVAIAAYLGSSDVFDQAVAAFAERYADQNERDHQSLCDAVASGRVEARPGI